MNTSERRTRSPSKTGSPASTDWLPNLNPKYNLSSRWLRRDVWEDLGQADWFYSFALALDAKDAVQAKMVLKFYLFLRNFSPQGLTGQFAHISGRMVMTHLLSQAETTPSRHKATKQADAAFAELELWMGKHETWQNALAGSRERLPGSNETVPRKAPGLHSPAGMIMLS